MSPAANLTLASYDLAASIAHHHSLAKDTTAKQTCYWGYFTSFLTTIDLHHDPFLSHISPSNQQRLLGTFAAAYHSGQVTQRASPATAPPISSTIRAALDAVAQTYRAHQCPSPCHDPLTGRLHFLLDRQLCGYTNQDPAPKPQKAITISLLRDLANVQDTPMDVAISQLACGAFFFAMRSCEYLSVSGRPRRTKLLQLQDIKFFSGTRELPHHDPQLRQADTISITFTIQKTNERDAVITHYLSGDPTFCPVCSWLGIVCRLWSYPQTTAHTPVNVVHQQSPQGGTLLHITSTQMVQKLRCAAHRLGKDCLGYASTAVGTHSLRSGAAMAMYLSNTPVFTIMLIGRWKSTAFLHYIRRQVQEFS